MPSVTAPMPSPSWSPPALSADAQGIGVYIHWPFCASKCPYCDFNSHVREQVDQRRWREALIAELRAEAALLPAGSRIASVFFGGGTPSLMPPETVGALIQAIDDLWPGSTGREITLEANPSSVEAGRFAALAAAGVNRVSLGLQALDDAALRFLGRRHDLAEGLAALHVARQLFRRVSFDLIYARPGQGLADWRRELARALELGADHLSLYQLTIEPGTAFAEQYRRKRFALPADDDAAALFALTQEMTEHKGLPAYETSNHAAPGEACAHNLVYWRYQPYIGIGPGAHGRRPRLGGLMATQRLKRPEAWLDAVERRGEGLECARPVSPREQGEEAVMMGLRLTEGIDLDDIARRTGTQSARLVDRDALSDLIALGLMRSDGARIAATAAGRPLLDALLAKLLT